MTVTILVLIIIAAGALYFYLKCNIMTAMTNLLAAVMGCILAFSYYEQLAGLLASEKWAVTWIQSVAFLLIFFFGFLFIRVLSGFLAKSDFDVGRPAKLMITIPIGILTGLFVSGALLIAAALSPIPPKLFYCRFPLSQPLHLGITYPPIINADGFTVSFYSWVSRGSLSSSKSFAVLHADYLTRLHLNRYALGQGIPAVCSPKAVKLPMGNVQPVRLRDFSDQPKLVVIRIGISGNPIAKGGAEHENKISFIPAQVALIMKEAEHAANLRGSASVVFPLGILQNNELKTINLHEPIVADASSLGTDRTLWLDLVFSPHAEKQPVLLAFKQNAIIGLPKPVLGSDEVEKALGPL
jgi:hypothetical protein